MRCEHCGCIFCPDYLEPGQRTRFCGRKCRKNAKNQRAAPQRKWRRTCRQKFAYPGPADAYTALRWLREAKGDPTGSIYECEVPGCGSWHVTSREMSGTRDA